MAIVYYSLSPTPLTSYGTTSLYSKKIEFNPQGVCTGQLGVAAKISYKAFIDLINYVKSVPYTVKTSNKCLWALTDTSQAAIIWGGYLDSYQAQKAKSIISAGRVA